MEENKIISLFNPAEESDTQFVLENNVDSKIDDLGTAIKVLIQRLREAKPLAASS